MERHARYLIVLALTVLTLLLAAFFWLWLAQKGETEDGQALNILFEEAVTGLNPGSTVRFLGVTAGKVRAIRLEYRNDRPVALVEVSLDPVVRLDQALQATLETSGITGQSTIALRPVAKAPPVQTNQGVREIRGQPSALGQLFERAPGLATGTQSALDKVNVLLADENQRLLKSALQNMAQAGEAFASLGQELSTLTAQVETSNQRFQATLEGFSQVAETLNGETLPAFRDAAATLTSSAEVVRDSAAGMQSEVRNSAAIFREFIAETNQSMTLMSEQFLRTALSAEQFAEELRAQPSQLLYRNPESALELAQ